MVKSELPESQAPIPSIEVASGVPFSISPDLNRVEKHTYDSTVVQTYNLDLSGRGTGQLHVMKDKIVALQPPHSESFLTPAGPVPISYTLDGERF